MSGVTDTVNTWTGYHNRFISPQEQMLYDHLLFHAECETPQQLTERFQALFIDGTGYPEQGIVRNLDSLLSAQEVEQYFHYVLNRCCHILINRWQRRSQLQTAIPELVERLEQGSIKPISEYSRSRQIRKLREIVAGFTETEQYLTLKRLALLIDDAEASKNSDSQPLGTLIRRYPYLYEHCVVSEGSPEEHQENIRQIRADAQRKFEIDLSQYVTYRVRRARLKRTAPASKKLQQLRSIANPTLLSDRELVASINQFSGKVDNGRTYGDAARVFLRQSQLIKFGEFKRDFYHYLTSSVDKSYGSRKFNGLLAQQLEHTLPQSEDCRLNDFLLARTCSQLLRFLVVDSAQNPEHFVFIDLINNIGPLMTTGLLLKIVLLCSKIKPYLERRFSILFSHYESAIQNRVSWLIKMLENLNVALSLTFGSVDLSSLLTA